MAKATIKDVDFKDKKVIMRVDFNVPLDKAQNITDDARIQAAKDSIQYILDRGAKKIILMSHLGRPKGKVVDSLRMNPVAKRLSQILNLEVEKVDDCLGEKIKQQISQSDKKIFLLENLRFHKQETEGDEDFAKELASLADVYVNDAFGTAHRAHASTAIIAKFLPSCVGFLIEKEINFLSKVTFNPAKPFVAILGGAKVSDKIGVVEQLLNKVDSIIIAGAMAYTFLKAQSIDVGASLVEEDRLDLAKQILVSAKEKGIEIVLPVDHVAVEDIDKQDTKKIVEQIPPNYKAVDIGPATIELFKEKLKNAKTVLWNGPLGIFENPAYAQGTKEIALFLSSLDAVVVVGGGDSAAAAKKFKVQDKLSHVSTGGGASLEFLEGKDLPGIAAVPDKN